MLLNFAITMGKKKKRSHDLKLLGINKYSSKIPFLISSILLHKTYQLVPLKIHSTSLTCTWQSFIILLNSNSSEYSSESYIPGNLESQVSKHAFLFLTPSCVSCSPFPVIIPCSLSPSIYPLSLRDLPFPFRSSKWEKVSSFPRHLECSTPVIFTRDWTKG
jgi:hypothetical protein